MNTRARLRRAVSHPILFVRHANRLYHRRLGQREHNPDGIDVFDEDWDTLCILDACRYDMFARCSELPGRLERRASKGSATTEFLTANLDGRDLRDTVYVTANPQLYRNRDSIDVTFHDVIHVWREEGWDEEHGTVLPETVTEYALRAAEEYPNKRLVVHYMQPHYPFIGSETDFDKGHLTGARQENVWNQLLQGTLDAEPDDIWRIYEANLERALPHVEILMENLDGKTVVTADHGNMVGERAFPLPIREWGHPRGIYTDELVAVPWLVFENGPRREIRTGDSESQSETVDEGVVADRLRQLGYAG
jgi:hypothetical protein